uniref:hypothetical protein n=1 Tax=Paraglaciecola marina TaxID=2500157 RepID=UPI00141509B0
AASVTSDSSVIETFSAVTVGALFATGGSTGESPEPLDPPQLLSIKMEAMVELHTFRKERTCMGVEMKL